MVDPSGEKRKERKRRKEQEKKLLKEIKPSKLQINI